MVQCDDRTQSGSTYFLYYRKWRRYCARPQCSLVERGPLKVIIATEMNVKSQRTSVIHGMSILLPSSKAKQLVIVWITASHGARILFFWYLGKMTRVYWLFVTCRILVLIGFPFLVCLINYPMTIWFFNHLCDVLASSALVLVLVFPNI